MGVYKCRADSRDSAHVGHSSKSVSIGVFSDSCHIVFLAPADARAMAADILAAADELDGGKPDVDPAEPALVAKLERELADVCARLRANELDICRIGDRLHAIEQSTASRLRDLEAAAQKQDPAPAGLCCPLLGNK